MAARFIAAAQDGNVDILREASRKDLNAGDEDGMTATIWAARNGNLEALRLIVGREGEVNKCDYLGLTPLHHAAMTGQLDVVSFLVHWGCNVYALDNDGLSPQDLASMHNYHDIMNFIDKVLDQKHYKNPKSVTRQKEEAVRASEINKKKYEKLKEAAAKRAEKEQRRMKMDMNEASSKPKKSLFQTLTLRMKGSSTAASHSPAGGRSNFSDMAGLTYARNPKGIAKKIQMRKSAETSTLSNGTDFKVSVRDEEGNRMFKSIGKSQGHHGTVSEVMYINTAKRSSEDDLGVSRRPLMPDFLNQKQNIYRAKSESDLLDSGVDSYNGDEDEDDENSPSLFNRTEFGKLSFLPKVPMLSTLQSFDDNILHQSAFDQASECHEQDDPDMSQIAKELGTTAKLPWSPDDVDGLDENDESGGAILNKLSSLETFLAANGLTNYLHVFSQEEIDLHLLMRMNDSELKGLGLPFGTRKKLADAIQKRKDILATPPDMVDTYL